jgi:hypothetical protein
MIKEMANFVEPFLPTGFRTRLQGRGSSDTGPVSVPSPAAPPATDSKPPADAKPPAETKPPQ